MVIKLNKQSLIEEAKIRQNNTNKIYSKIDIVNRSNQLVRELAKFCKKNNILKTDIILFGSIVLGLKGYRYPNDLDIGLKKEIYEKLQPKYKSFSKTGSYGAQFDINDLSFINELALPKLNGQNIFTLKFEYIDEFPIITFNTWKQMQKNDPLQKDKKWL